VVADDEPLARERLRMLLERRPEYEIVAECEDGAQTVEAIVAARPDVVFLDIRMPELSGIEVAETLAARAGSGAAPPDVVFVTAYDAYALRAFEVSAVDYLLKPVDRERLDRALARVASRRAARPAGAAGVDPEMRAFLEALRSERAYPARFLVRDAKGLYFVRADEVEWVDAQANYVGLHARGRVHLVRDTMRAFEAKLDPSRFVRVHRSAIVNLDHVRRLEPHAHGEYVITLADGTRLTSSRAHGARLHALLR
jgi:two-component system LytT family response regulator